MEISILRALYERGSTDLAGFPVQLVDDRREDSLHGPASLEGQETRHVLQSSTELLEKRPQQTRPPPGRDDYEKALRKQELESPLSEVEKDTLEQSEYFMVRNWEKELEDQLSAAYHEYEELGGFSTTRS